MRFLFSLFFIVIMFHSSAQEQRIGDTTATGIVTYSLRAINGKGIGNRTAVFDSLGKLIPSNANAIPTLQSVTDYGNVTNRGMSIINDTNTSHTFFHVRNGYKIGFQRSLVKFESAGTEPNQYNILRLSAPNAPVGSRQTFSLGANERTRNMAFFQFNYVGDGSVNNYLELQFWSIGDVMRIYADKRLVLYGPATVNSLKATNLVGGGQVVANADGTLALGSGSTGSVYTAGPGIDITGSIISNTALNNTWTIGGNENITTSHFIGTTNSQPLIFKTSNSEALRITPSGQVGIGTAYVATNFEDASYKLFVEGNIKARKIKVDAANWADYVFEDSYKLPPLKEVEQFIKTHKHLPDVPSANEVKEKGLDLGENQVVLLKKIEELTLYVIDQNKKMDEVNKINEDQTKRLEDQTMRNKELEERLKRLEAKLN